MTIFLLATSIANRIIEGDIVAVRESLAAVPVHSVAISIVTQAELLYGVAKRGHPVGLATRVREFLLRVELRPWTSEAAGITLAPMDAMIAAHAKAADTILVTRNRVFARLPGH